MSDAASKLHERADILMSSTLGLKWKETGSSRPNTGIEIDNPDLAMALKDKLEFTQAEFAKFRALDLFHDSFIRATVGVAGEKFFRPAPLGPDSPVRRLYDEVEKMVLQALRIYNRIEDDCSSDVVDVLRRQLLADASTQAASKQVQSDEHQHLLRLYDLASIVKTHSDHEESDPSEFAKMLIRKGDVFAKVIGRGKDALVAYRQALDVLPETEVTQISKLLHKGGLLLQREGEKVGAATLGLKWRNIGATKPTRGRLLENQELEKILTAQMELTKTEWAAVDIKDLCMDDFVKVDDSYFVPAVEGNADFEQALEWLARGFALAEEESVEKHVTDKKLQLLGADILQDLGALMLKHDSAIDFSSDASGSEKSYWGGSLRKRCLLTAMVRLKHVITICVKISDCMDILNDILVSAWQVPAYYVQGLKWKKVLEKPKGLFSIEINNDPLAKALPQKTLFCQEELDAFKLVGLSSDHYIKVDESYFKPDGDRMLFLLRVTAGVKSGTVWEGSGIDYDTIMATNGIQAGDYAGEVVPPSNLLEEALARKVDVLQGLGGNSATLMAHLRKASPYETKHLFDVSCNPKHLKSVVSSQDPSRSGILPLEYRVFMILSRQDPSTSTTDALSNVVRGMKSAAHDALESSFVQEWGSCALRALLVRRALDGQEPFGSGDGGQDSLIGALSGAAQTHPENPDVVREVCKAFLSIIELGQPLDNFVHHDVTKTVLMAVERHKSNLQVQEHAVHVIHHLVQNSRSDDKATKEALIFKIADASQYIKLLLTSLQGQEIEKMPDENLQETLNLRVLEILETLVDNTKAGESAEKVREAIAFMGNEGYFKRIIQNCMARFVGNGCIQQCGKNLMENRTLEKNLRRVVRLSFVLSSEKCMFTVRNE